jgi:hypothetical protein
MTVVHLGTPLRDAAVDPKPEDFLPPTYAGQANPHGPHVVSVQALSPRSGLPPFVAGQAVVVDGGSM